MKVRFNKIVLESIFKYGAGGRVDTDKFEIYIIKKSNGLVKNNPISLYDYFMNLEENYDTYELYINLLSMELFNNLAKRNYINLYSGKLTYSEKRRLLL